MLSSLVIDDLTHSFKCCIVIPGNNYTTSKDPLIDWLSLRIGLSQTIGSSTIATFFVFLLFDVGVMSTLLSVWWQELLLIFSCTYLVLLVLSIEFELLLFSFLVPTCFSTVLLSVKCFMTTFTAMIILIVDFVNWFLNSAFSSIFFYILLWKCQYLQQLYDHYCGR